MKMRHKQQQELAQIHQLLQQNRNNLSAINQVAQVLLARRFPLGQALQAYADYLTSQPGSANAAYNHAWYLARDGQFEAAVRLYRRALELGIDQPEEVHLNIANLYMDHLDDEDRAREALHAALAIRPDYYGAHYNLGNLAEQKGNREQATVCFRRCIEIEPNNHTALARLADSHRFRSSDDPLLARLIETARSSDNSDLHFSLGSAFNQLADFEAAWRHFAIANSIERKALPPYSHSGTEALFERIISRSSGEWLGRFPADSHRPVFICGMFRSGSTLLEQILAAHPCFTPAGESEFFPRLVLREFHDYPEGLDEVTEDELRSWRGEHARYSDRITTGATRLTDKRPDNFLYVGLIKAVLPSAKIIVTERDWRDVAISILAMRLGASQNYATDLADIRHYIGQQERLCDHWQSILGNDLVRVRYEELVTQPREAIGALLGALGEEWDERCLAFDQLDNSVKTGSVWQVREPLHARSVGRWKNYRRQFEQAFGSDAIA